jgi:hypothetical protein
MTSKTRRLHLAGAHWSDFAGTRNFLRTRLDSSGESLTKRARYTGSNYELTNMEDASLATLVGVRLQQWIQCGSWATCNGCHSLYARELHSLSDAMVSFATSDSCGACTGGYVVPNMYEIPLQLHGLNNKVVFALRPLEVHLGNPLRVHPQGYVRHDQAIRFSWKLEDVTIGMSRLSDRDRQYAEAAFGYLMGSASSAYASFVLEHRKHLRSTGVQNRLPMNFLLRRYLECALWPDLYPFKSWCDSACSGSEARMLSPKASFLLKVLSSVADYAESFEILQFQYDRSIFSVFTGRAVASKGLALKYALKTVGETPYASFLNHMKLVDIHRQLGPASFWITIAPGIYGFPLHHWVREQVTLSGSNLTTNAAAEALHVHHVLNEVIHHWLFGSKDSPFWNSTKKESCVLAYADTIEFQEGTRRETANATKPNVPGREGTGVEHRHLLVWTHKAQESRLSTVARADWGQGDSQLEEAVRRTQLSKSSSTPIREQSTQWVFDQSRGQWTLMLHHPLSAHVRGLRAYLTPLTAARIGHTDFQICNGKADVLAYSAAYIKYATKNSFALDADAVEKGSSGFQAAYAMLQYLHPAAPQMVVSLSRGALTSFSCATKEIYPPTPADMQHSKEYMKYLACRFRSQTMNFVEWMRAFRHELDVPTPYQRTKGPVVAAAICYASRFSDSFCGQWLLLWIPWDLHKKLPPSCDQVPADYRFFEACRVLDPLHWESNRSLRQELEVEGHKPTFVEGVLARFRAAHEVCDLVLKGKLVFHEPTEKTGISYDQLNNSQRRFVMEVSTLTLRVQSGDQEYSSVYAMLGEAGTGKSTALNALVDKIVGQNFLVYICTPTGALADVYRLQYASSGLVKVDTFDGLFRFLSGEGPMPYCILDAALVIVDEVSQLGIKKFEFAFRCWALAGKRPTMVFAGDFKQGSPPSGDAPAKISKYWQGPLHAVSTITLSKQQRMTGKLSLITRMLRIHAPTLNNIKFLVGKRILSSGAERSQELRAWYREFPQGVLLAGRRVTVKHLNMEVLSAFFPEGTWKELTIMNADQDDCETGLFCEGARVMVTRNVNKGRGLVNGAMGSLQYVGYYSLVIQLDSGKTCSLPRQPIMNSFPVVLAYPLQLGYATTVSKIQGRTLQAVAIEPDLSVKGLAYTAITRVRSAASLWWLSRPTRSWFRVSMDA